MEKTEQCYDLEVWEYDFLVDHFLSNEEVLYYNEGNKELGAMTERDGSNIYFHVEGDDNVTWFSVFSYNEGEELGEEYLDEIVEKRLQMVYEK
ncbi:MAG: hypothetical protein BRC28_00930 [Nanohaloarchaea archaeon SW_4_43_9]|nr:MAG: hypothetical protein BRC28_00930 [Nanohaloarchaea archaeon SW_4_43_9]